MEQHRFATLDRNKQYSPTRVRTASTGGEYTHIWEVRRPDIPGVSDGEVHCGTMPKGSQCGTIPRVHHHCGTLPKNSHCVGTIIKDHEGTMGRNREIKKRASFSTFKPSDDHIYQSPSFARRHHLDANGIPIEGVPPFYFELDPKMVPSNMVDQCSVPNIICGPGCELNHQTPHV